MIQNFVKTVVYFNACVLKKSLRTEARVNVTVKNVLCILKNCAWVVSKDNFNLCATLLNKTLIVLNVVNACEWVLLIAEKLSIRFEIQNVCIWVNALFVKQAAGSA